MRFASLALFTSLAFAPAAALSTEVTSFELDNGMEVVVVENRRAPVVVHMVWYRVGAADEPPGVSGIAHFLEHMAFKGTARRSALQIAEAIEDVGGYINAYTSREVTAYYARVLGEHVPLALDVVANILRRPVFDLNEIEIERGVIRAHKYRTAILHLTDLKERCVIARFYEIPFWIDQKQPWWRPCNLAAQYLGRVKGAVCPRPPIGVGFNHFVQGVRNQSRNLKHRRCCQHRRCALFW